MDIIILDLTVQFKLLDITTQYLSRYATKNCNVVPTGVNLSVLT